MKVHLIAHDGNLGSNTTLKKKIKNLEKKEAEDTKALADMVQKVEENLVLSAVSVDVCVMVVL